MLAELQPTTQCSPRALKAKRPGRHSGTHAFRSPCGPKYVEIQNFLLNTNWKGWFNARHLSLWLSSYCAVLLLLFNLFSIFISNQVTFQINGSRTREVFRQISGSNSREAGWQQAQTHVELVLKVAARQAGTAASTLSAWPSVNKTTTVGRSADPELMSLWSAGLCRDSEAQVKPREGSQPRFSSCSTRWASLHAIYGTRDAFPCWCNENGKKKGRNISRLAILPNLVGDHKTHYSC